MIEIRALRKSYGDLQVIKGIDASVAKGEVICIVGPSGSGKSTILRCINGLESYEGGVIDIDGIKVDRKAPTIKAIRTEVAMVFQRFNLFPHRTVLENVIEGPIYVKKEDRKQATEQRYFVQDDQTLDTVPQMSNPESINVDRQTLGKVDRALAQLPKRARYAFLMYRVHGKPQKDIATELGVSPTLVNFMIRDASVHCRKFVGAGAGF